MIPIWGLHLNLLITQQTELYTAERYFVLLFLMHSQTLIECYQVFCSQTSYIIHLHYTYN